MRIRETDGEGEPLLRFFREATQCLDPFARAVAILQISVATSGASKAGTA